MNKEGALILPCCCKGAHRATVVTAHVGRWKNIVRAIAAVAMALLFLPTSSVSAQIELLEKIENIPDYVTEVYPCGHWYSADSEGYFRIIYIDFYYGNSLLYIQWVKASYSAEPSPEIVTTASISEFNADDHIELTFPKPVCKEMKDGVELVIKAESGHDENEHHFKLRVFLEPGKYSLKESSPLPRERHRADPLP